MHEYERVIKWIIDNFAKRTTYSERVWWQVYIYCGNILYTVWLKTEQNCLFWFWFFWLHKSTDMYIEMCISVDLCIQKTACFSYAVLHISKPWKWKKKRKQNWKRGVGCKKGGCCVMSTSICGILYIYSGQSPLTLPHWKVMHTHTRTCPISNVICRVCACVCAIVFSPNILRTSLPYKFDKMSIWYMGIELFKYRLDLNDCGNEP